MHFPFLFPPYFSFFHFHKPANLFHYILFIHLSFYPFIISPASCPFLLNSLPLLSPNKPASFRVIFPQKCFMPHIMTHIIRLAVCTTLFSTNCCTDGRGKAQMGRGQFFIGCSIPQSPTHLVCREKHLCTNLFVTIH